MVIFLLLNPVFDVCRHRTAAGSGDAARVVKKCSLKQWAKIH
jgi:hypothetical protein